MAAKAGCSGHCRGQTLIAKVTRGLRPGPNSQPPLRSSDSGCGVDSRDAPDGQWPSTGN